MESRPYENASDEHIEFWLWKHTGWRWRVLAREDARVLVLTDDILESRPFDDVADDNVSWETSTLRKHLNESFFGALPVEIRERVVLVANSSTEVEALGSCAFGAPRSLDRVFLLSESEAATYLKAGDRQGAECAWWLRPEDICSTATACGVGGSQSFSATSCSPTATLGVRAALCVDVSSSPKPDLDCADMKPGWGSCVDDYVAENGPAGVTVVGTVLDPSRSEEDIW